MTGGKGDDKFYYKQDHADANIFDTITDFRKPGFGADQIIAGVTQTSSHTRSTIFNDTSQHGSAYQINNNAGQLPTIFNFTYDTNTTSINTASALSSHLSSFYVSPDGSSAFTIAEQFILAIGDGDDTFTWLWEDTSKGGAVDSNELYPIAILTNYNNDNLNGSEFQYQTLSGI